MKHGHLARVFFTYGVDCHFGYLVGLVTGKP